MDEYKWSRIHHEHDKQREHHEVSLNNVKSFFKKSLATKADYAAALRGYQNAVDEMSSPDRDEAKASGH